LDIVNKLSQSEAIAAHGNDRSAAEVTMEEGCAFVAHFFAPTGWTIVPVTGICELWPLRSGAARGWLEKGARPHFW